MTRAGSATAARRCRGFCNRPAENCRPFHANIRRRKALSLGVFAVVEPERLVRPRTGSYDRSWRARISMQSIESVKRTHRTALVLLGHVLALSSVASGQTQSVQRARSEDLTRALVSLNSSYQGADSTGRAALIGDMLATAAERRQLLASMLESDPGQVLRVALSPELRASLPAVVRTAVEQHVDLEGELEVLQEDYANGARLRHSLYSGGTRLLLQFAGNPPELLTGDRVRVRGVRLDDTLALQSGTTSLTSVQSAAAAAVLPNTFGEQRTMVLMVNFQDNLLQPYTLADAQSMVFT